jgi:hypothetical protein
MIPTDKGDGGNTYRRSITLLSGTFILRAQQSLTKNASTIGHALAYGALFAAKHPRG